jgi:tRNA (cytidine/uridine-2'-O-)-methyltransferase
MENSSSQCGSGLIVMAGKRMLNLNVVLYEPLIPQNTGNIARTCAAVGVKLHLIKPLGFRLDNRNLKRAGLDYWPLVDLCVHRNFPEFLSAHPNAHMAFLTKKASRTYDTIDFSGDIFLVFGNEEGGLPPPVIEKYKDLCFRIPMVAGARSLNLASSATVVIYEALRQNGFPGLELRGERPDR